MCPLQPALFSKHDNDISGASKGRRKGIGGATKGPVFCSYQLLSSEMKLVLMVRHYSRPLKRYINWRMIASIQWTEIQAPSGGMGYPYSTSKLPIGKHFRPHAGHQADFLLYAHYAGCSLIDRAGRLAPWRSQV